MEQEIVAMATLTVYVAHAHHSPTYYCVKMFLITKYSREQGNNG